MKFTQLAISGYTIQKEEENISDLGSVYTEKFHECESDIVNLQFLNRESAQFCDVVNNNDVKHQRKASLRNRSVWMDPYQEIFFKRILMVHEWIASYTTYVVSLSC